MNKQKITISILLLAFVFGLSGCATSSGGCMSGNCSNGHGTFIYPTGDRYTGGMKNGQRSGQGTYTDVKGYTYVGEWKDHQMNGMGTYTGTDGRKYVGEYKDGKKHGQGTYSWAGGSHYTGEFKDGDFSGQGTYTWSDGDKYVGQFKDDERNGDGTFYYTNGRVVKGRWENSKRVKVYSDTNNENSQTVSSSTSATSCISGDCRNGQGTYLYASGNKYVGFWKDGKKHGQGTKIWPDGDKYVGAWNEGKRNGQGTYSWKSGSKYTGGFKDGNKEGEGMYFFANGRVIEGRWENNKRVVTYSDSEADTTSSALVANTSTTGHRVALVIGNSQYQYTPRLPNPENDARSIARELTQMGFDTELVLDVNRASFDSALKRFGDRSENAEASLFYYAGHALEVNGINYLMPVDATLSKKRYLKRETIALNDILDDMEGASQVRLVFLDACRDNPLSSTLARGMGNSRSAIGRGLARVDASTGTLISYATKTGAIADDGDGAHSPYTQALLDHMNTSGLDIGLMLRRVRSSVISSTNSKQVPWDSSSLLGEFYMQPK